MGRGGADDQGFQIGKACRIAGRAAGGGSGWCGRSSHGIRIAGKGERCEGEVAGGRGTDDGVAAVSTGGEEDGELHAIILSGTLV